MACNKELGDFIEGAIALVGINKTLVEQWLNRPCHCEERKQRLNDLSRWAKRVTQGRIQQAATYLARIVTH